MRCRQRLLPFLRRLRRFRQLQRMTIPLLGAASIRCLLGHRIARSSATSIDEIEGKDGPRHHRRIDGGYPGCPAVGTKSSTALLFASQVSQMKTIFSNLESFSWNSESRFQGVESEFSRFATLVRNCWSVAGDVFHRLCDAGHASRCARGPKSGIRNTEISRSGTAASDDGSSNGGIRSKFVPDIATT